MNTQARRKPTNLSLDETLLSDARALEVNLSRAAEDGIRAEVQRAKAIRWQQENAEALESSNAYIDQNGIPLERHRKF